MKQDIHSPYFKFTYDACSGLTAYSALKKIPNTGPEDWIIIIGAGGVGINGILLCSAVQKAKILVIDKFYE